MSLIQEKQPIPTEESTAWLEEKEKNSFMQRHVGELVKEGSRESLSVCT